MVAETVTMEGHLIDSDILRKAFARIVEDGGEFEVLEFQVGKTNDDPSFVRLAVRPRRPTPSTGSWRTSATWAPPRRPAGRATARSGGQDPGRGRALRARGGGRHPARRVLLDHQLRHLRARGRASGSPARDQKMDCALVLRDGAPTCVKQGQVQGGRAGRAARAGHPRASARAQPRLLGVRLHVERRLRGDQQGHRDRGQRARDAAHARGGREDRGGGGARHRALRAATSPWPAWCATAGWTCCSPATPSPRTTSRRRSSRRASASAR